MTAVFNCLCNLPPNKCWSNLTLFSPTSRKIPQAADLQAPPPSVKTISSSLHSSSLASSSLSSKIRTGSHVSSSNKMTSLSSSNTCGPGVSSGTLQSENSMGSGSGHLAFPKKPTAECQLGAGRHKNAAGRPSKPMLKQREEAAAAAAALRKRKAPSQEGEHSGPNRNCILLQDRGRPPSSSPTSSSASTKLPFLSPHPHAQTNGTISPSSKPRSQPSPSDSHSPATKAVWTYRQTHLSHSSPLDPPYSANNSHSRGGLGDSTLHRQAGGRGFEQHGLGKKRKSGGTDEHSPSPKPSVHRLPSSSSSSSGPSSAPRANFYPWKDSKSGGLSGGVDKKLGTSKVSANIGNTTFS